MPRRGLGVAPGAREPREDGAGGVEAPNGPAPAVCHAPDLADLRRREHPRVRLDLVYCGGEALAPGEVVSDLRYSDGLAQPGVRGPLGGRRCREVFAELLDHALTQHIVDAPIEVFVQNCLVDIDPEETAGEPERRPVSGRRSGEWVPRGVVVKSLGEEGVDEGVGPAGHHWHAPAGRDVGRRGGGERAERGGGQLAGVGADGAEEVVDDAAAVGGHHLVGGDVEAAVKLDLVGVHHLAIEL
uniref:Uncharacterized protein n=1 Tax=Triticum urartu TaxID=4572 RepID=A0A8R7TWP2_TRIUA